MVVHGWVVLYYIITERIGEHLDVDFFSLSSIVNPDQVVVIRVMEYGSTRPYKPIIGMLP